MKPYIVGHLVSIAGLCLLAACAPQAPSIEMPESDLVWPEPPATPRIRFLYTLAEPEDIDIRAGFFGRIMGAFRGPEARGIHSPYGLTRDAEGRLYVVDNFYQAVHVYDPGKNKYYRFPEKSPEAFRNPVDIALGSGGRIYVSDSVAGRVHVFSQQGTKYLRSIGAGQLQRPTGLAVNHKTGELLVLDTMASQLLVFDEGDLSLKRTVGGDNGDSGSASMFHLPTNVAVAGNGRVYVTDSMNFRIQALSAELELTGSFGAAGNVPGNFSRPKGLATDSDGHVYVIDALFDNVQIFDDQGDLLLAFGAPGHEPGKFWLPNAIFIDPDDRIYVSDSHNKRVQVFQYLKQAENLQ